MYSIGHVCAYYVENIHKFDLRNATLQNNPQKFDIYTNKTLKSTD